MNVAMLAPGLLRAAAVFEEWSLVDEAPLREVVVIRAHYDADADRDALLPAPVSARAAPRVWDAATGAALTVRCGAQGCVARLPGPGARRVVARIERASAAPRAFALRWPPAGSPGAQRVIAMPRAWSDAQPEGWRCPGLDVDERVCVDRGTAAPFELRVPARRSSRGQWFGAALTTSAALWLAGRLGRDPIEARLASLGGIAVAAACALALVGARASSWAVALSVLTPLGAAVGALATRGRLSRAAGALGLALIPVAAVVRAPAAVVFVAGGAVALTTLAELSSPATSR
ncbi:MAG: hypothetical protein U0325_24530 [Polyangiales bacterium]